MTKLRSKTMFDPQRSLSATVALFGLRAATRPYVRDQRSRFALVLIVPDPEDTLIYFHAARRLLGEQDFEPGSGCVIVLSSELRRNAAVWSSQDIRTARRGLVICKNEADVTSDLRLLADEIIHLKAPTVRHFQAASRQLGFPEPDAADGEFLAGLSLTDVQLAMRPGQPISRGLARLRKERQPIQDKLDVKEELRPNLEEMMGYGEARHWGLQLARDLSQYGRGELAWEEVDRGILLHGAPGCGKTTFARALSNSCRVPLVLGSAGRWQAAGHLGDMLKAMRAAFHEAENKRPSILFIDEFDSFGDRSTNVDWEHADYKRQVINALLELLDPADGREGVVVIGATNSLRQIDKAFLRAGRLEKVVEIDLPSAIDRIHILRYHLGDHIPLGDLKDYADASEGFTGADIEMLAREAKRRARLRNKAVTITDVIASLPPREALDRATKYRLAVHEGGHALMSVLLKCGDLQKVYINNHFPGKHGPQVLGEAVIEHPRMSMVTKANYLDRIALLLGGIAAERVVFGEHGSGAGGQEGSDLVVATDIATTIESGLGFGTTLVADLGTGNRSQEWLRQRDDRLRRAVDETLAEQLERSVAAVTKNRGTLEAIASALVERNVLFGSEVRQIVEANRRERSGSKLVAARERTPR